VFSRRIVGWSMATTLATALVLDALNRFRHFTGGSLALASLSHA
jgi:transposase InsO family protein